MQTTADSKVNPITKTAKTKSEPVDSKKKGTLTISSLVNKKQERAAARKNATAAGGLDEAMARLKHHRAAYIAKARVAAHVIASGRIDRSCTIDDVRMVEPPPESIDPRVMGAIFSEKGVWRGLGYERSVRSTSHHRPVQRFQLIEY